MNKNEHKREKCILIAYKNRLKKPKNGYKDLNKDTKFAKIAILWYNNTCRVKRRVYIILKKAVKYYTKESCKLFSIMALALGLIIAIILLKYKPTYKVIVKGQEIGYVDSEQNLEDRIQSEIIEMQGKNIDFVSLDDMPSYEFKLVSRSRRCNEDEIMVALKENARIMYKYYAVILNQETVGLVDNIEEAEQAINQIKEEHKNDTIDLELSVIENYTENINEISTETVQVAQAQVEEKVSALIAEEQAKKQAEEQARKEAEEKAKKEAEEKSKSPVVRGVLLAVTPVTGTITSRFGAVSSIRSGAHTGTDIAAPSGTPIKAVASGTVTFAARSGSYGNLIKISHENGVETWYGHCSELYATEGQQVEAGEIIAAVGSTGNSTGPHLHLEIRVNGIAVNPQTYLYK